MSSNPGSIGWRQIIDTFLLDLKQAFSAPSANPAVTLIVVLIVAILLTILILLGVSIYLFLTRGKRAAFWVKVTVTKRDIWVGRIFFLLFLIALLLSGTYYAQNDRNCLNCHKEGLEKKSLEKTSHKGLQCIACHMKPGITGYLQQKLDFLRWGFAYLARDKVPPSSELKGNVSDSSCLKCHREVIEKTILKYNLRVSHKEIYEGGFRCVDCHNQVAHPKVSVPEKSPSMDTCLLCHDGKKASYSCSECHTKDVGKGVRPAKRELPKTEVAVTWNWCYGECHNEKKECLPCHGTTMPHPPGWANGRLPIHPKEAAFEKKQLCWRCHYSDRKPFTKGDEFCGKCHPIEFHGKDEIVYWSHQQFSTSDCAGLCHSAETCTKLCHGEKKAKVLPPPYKNYPFKIPGEF